jgi:hypothetical protein
MTLVAEKNLDTISQRDTQHTSARRWIHNVGKKISIFVHGVPGKISLKLTTAKGDANIWAQSGDVEIVGNNDLRIHANKGKVEIFAGEEALFNCGGAYIRIKGGGIDFHAPGKIEFKAANYVWSGPARQKLETKKFGEPKQCGGENAAEPYTPLLAMMPPVAVASGASANELPAETEELGETNETEELSETDESDEESDTDADREAALEAAKASGKTMNCKAPYTLADFEKAKQKVAQASAPKLSGLPASISGVIGTVSGIAGIVGGIAGTVAMVAKLTGNSDLAGQAGMVALGGIAIGAVGGIAKWGMGKIFGTPPAALTDAASGAAGAAGAATDAVSNAAGQASDAAKNAASSAADAAKNATGGPGQWT